MILTHVERRLMHYCPPPAHQWQPVPGASNLESCATCQRTRPLGSPACLLCDNDGIQTFRLENQPSGQHTDGPLCARCQAEFAYRGAILGWTARATSHDPLATSTSHQPPATSHEPRATNH